MNNLEGKVALVTGGTRGIGRGIAEAFLSAGARVAVNGRSPEKGAATIEALRVGDRAWYVGGDVTQQSAVDAMVDATLHHFGRIDILVNNATADLEQMIGKPSWELPLELWDDVIGVGLRSHYVASMLAAPLMIPQQSGLIVNVSYCGTVKCWMDEDLII